MVRRGAASLVAALLLVLFPVPTNSNADTASGGARVVSHGSRAAHTIALTFDDGWSPQNCRRIFAELVAQRVPATFFPTAAAMRIDPAFWHLVAKAGYPIGDHTMTHPHLPRLGYLAQLRQMTSSRVLVESIIGGPMLDVFRPPYGEYDARTRAAAAAAGFSTLLLWDVDSRDWSSSDTMHQKLAAAERGTNGSIVLLHCGPNATPYLVRDVIKFYRHHGFRFVTVPTLLGLAWRPGAKATASPKDILGGLSPFPPSPPGSARVGIDSTFPSDPSDPLTALPTATPPPDPSVPASPSPSPQTRSEDPSNGAASPTASPSVGAGGGAASAPTVVTLVAIELALFALLLTVATLL